MLSAYIETAKNLLFPCICLHCEKKIFQNYLCSICQGKIVSLCSEPLSKTENLDRIISATSYKEPMVSLIHLFKYKNHEYLAQFLTDLIIKHILKVSFNLGEYDFITAVPMHKYKLKIRGFNHAQLLAKLLSNYFKTPINDGIISVINIKPSQAKLKAHTRQKNVEGIFMVKEELKNKKIILVDDIFTTGATAKSCAKTLKEKGANKIILVTLSRTV